MWLLRNYLFCIFRICVGLLLLALAAGIPVYFTSVDKFCVLASNSTDDMSAEKLAQLYLDGAKLSSALLLARAVDDEAAIEPQVKSLYEEHPRWIAGGGDDPFFEAFFSTIDTNGAAAPQKFYPLLSTESNRRKLVDFLSQTNLALVKRVISMRDMNSVLLSPVYSSAGAPLDCAILTSALLVQTGDFNQKFLRIFADLIDNARTDQSKKNALEKFFIAELVYARDLDWTQMRTLLAHFDTPEQVYEFAKLYSSCGDPQKKRIIVAGLLMSGNPDEVINYLGNFTEEKFENFSYALLHGSGSLNFLLENDRQIYKNSMAASAFEKLTEPIKKFLAPYCVKSLVFALVLKILIVILGGYFLARGLVRIFIPRRDTPAWYSPLALARGFLEALVVGSLFFVLFEPQAFTIKIEEGSPPQELKFAFEKIVNNIQEETMNLQTDTATLLAVGLFLVMQFMVYVFCLIRLASIKRLKVSAQLQLKLLENEENLFDLGLYIGLAGTVISLVLLTLGVVTASLMAAYMSTLFGILFTAMVKVIHVRRYKRRLLLEIER